MVDLSKITLNPENPRQISKDKFEKLKQSVREFPRMLELRPIVVDSSGMILGGNMRFRAIKELGWELKPEWIKEADKLTEEEQRKFIAEDNIGHGDWDWNILANQYDKEELEGWGLDIEKWTDDEVIEDEVPEVSDEPAISKMGEIYQLGKWINCPKCHKKHHLE
jgi:ParB-like chromosome segregation protein Spo0J